MSLPFLCHLRFISVEIKDVFKTPKLDQLILIKNYKQFFEKKSNISKNIYDSFFEYKNKSAKSILCFYSFPEYTIITSTTYARALVKPCQIVFM